MSGGSYLRFFIGLVLSITVMYSFFVGEKISAISMLLSVIFIILAVAWAIFKF